MNQIKPLPTLSLMIMSLTVWSACTLRPTEQRNKEYQLPLNLKAVYWDSDVQKPIIGLVIEDELNFVIVGKEDKFLVNKDTLQVEKIERLGIGQERLLLELMDTKNNKFYIECTENSTGPDYEVNLITSESIDRIDQKGIKWIQADEIVRQLK